MGSSDNISHLVLGGLEGVGKTTISKALAIGCAVCLGNMLPVMWCYDHDPGLHAASDGHAATPMEHMARAATLLRIEAREVAVLPAAFDETPLATDTCFATRNFV